MTGLKPMTSGKDFERAVEVKGQLLRVGEGRNAVSARAEHDHPVATDRGATHQRAYRVVRAHELG